MPNSFGAASFRLMLGDKFVVTSEKSCELNDRSLSAMTGDVLAETVDAAAAAASGG